MLVPSAGVATSTHESPAVTIASPLDVFTIALELRAGSSHAGLTAECHLDRYRRFRCVGESVEPAAPVGAAVDVDRARDRDARHIDRLSCDEAIDAVKSQTETAHHLAVEARSRIALHKHADAAESVDRRAERRILTRPRLRCADAAGVDARRSGILDAPPGAVCIGHIIEGCR